MRLSVPVPLKMQLQKFRFLPHEAWDWMCGRHNPLLPPRWLRFVGGGDFMAVGERFAEHFRRLANLRPDEHVLDVGCGVGRIALALTNYLQPPGSYDGFDIVPAGIDWCRRAITARFPHFTFQHADVYNAAYNPNGRCQASSFGFPYGDATFDFVFMTSVFTHMLPDDMCHYLHEARRVLRPEGRCMATFFLLDVEARRLMNSERSLYDFRHDAGGYFTTSPDRPEAAIAYDKETLLSHLRRAGLRLDAHYAGGWCGREGAMEGQDIVLASPGALG
jgi:ubiquinone/menaquinone biosynthesis C-methylase UbiE